jgi:hypothetical protein
MNELQSSARAIAHTHLNFKKLSMEITNEIILEVIEEVVHGLNKYGHINKDELFQILVSDFSIGAGSISVLNEKYEPWLDEFKPSINWELWHRYSLFMKKNDPSFPINDLDKFTDKILDNCANPNKSGSWDKRGMVVGHVQSGKTSNFIGLINKATDAGYKVVIILAGTISSLRIQTQERVDEGFIGRSSSNAEQNIIGVGQYSADKKIYPLTTTYYQNGDKGDFNIASANKFNYPIGESPVVFVIKKNSSILTNLIHWLSGNENVKEVNGQLKLFGIPALIIDDEADAASVNTTKDIDKVKTINKLIRTLLNLFDQKTFIGYTATPYANLFINQEYNEELTTKIKNRTFHIGADLFPSDFIINLKAPKNYIGASKVFGYEDPVTTVSNEPLPIFRTINDFDPPFFQKINKDNVGTLPAYIPKSLYQAIQSFILVCAIRRLRNQENKHNSMLVHVALYTKWIDRVAYLVNDVLTEFKNKIDGNDLDFILELKALYISDFIPITDIIKENLDYIDNSIVHHKWEDVFSELKSAVSKIKVRAVHSVKTLGNLEYDGIEELDYNRYKSNGFSVIAVGGSRLSRGITLQGLSVSYYLRTTKMYDSLMQMGRWFGYRPGYIDLCRLFTTNEIFEWFNHITMATEEMRNDFDEMTITHQRPIDFRLKVRNHPGALTITSLSKMYWSREITVSLSGINRQTYSLSKDSKTIKHNFKIFNELIQSIGLPEKIDRIYNISGRLSYLLYRDQNIDFLCDFIDNYIIDQPSIKNSTISDYIRAQSKLKSIKEWSIGIISNTNKEVQYEYDKEKLNGHVMTYNIEYNGEIISIGCNLRTDNNPKDLKIYTIKKNQIDSPKDRIIDLNYGTKVIDAKQQRAKEKKGLLLIYSLDERGTKHVNTGFPIIGYSLHFPRVENEQMVSYTSNITSDFDELPQIDDDELDN